MECPVCGYDNMEVEISDGYIRRWCPECGEYQHRATCTPIPILNDGKEEEVEK